MITVHGMSMSGNRYKVQLALDPPGRSCRWHGGDAPCGASRTPALLAPNPAGRAPLLEPGDGFDFSRYPALRAWLARVRATPGSVPMPATDAEATARFAPAQRATVHA